MSTLFLRNGRLLSLVLAMILVGGLSAFTAIPRQEDPRIINRAATILTVFPGATAERVEALVTEKIEQRLREISEIDTISSSSRSGISVITIEVDETLSQREVDEAMTEARDALADVQPQLPAGARVPVFDDKRGFAFTIITALTWEGAGKPPLHVLRRHAKELQNRLRSLSGAELVRIYGAPEEEIVVSVDLDRLAAAGLTPSQVAAAISRADAKVAAGRLHGKKKELLIEVSGELDTLTRIRNIPVLRRADGVTLRVGDIATIKKGFIDPPDEIALIGRKQGVTVAIRMAEDRRVDTWSATVLKALDDYRAVLPDRVKLDVRFNQAAYTETRLDTLMTNLAVGTGLVILVLLITLGWRSALIVTATLPLTSLLTLTILNFVGIPIDQISVTGMIVALGLLVDNAIVVTDAIRARRQQGIDALTAVRLSIGHLWVPLLASTLTTVFAFFPIVLLPGSAGEFVSALGISVVISLICSYFLAMTVIPGLAGRFIKGSEDGKKRGFLTNGITVPWVTRAFGRSIDAALKYPKIAIMTVSIVPVMGFLAAGTLTEQFFPPADRDQFHIQLRLPTQASIGETRVAVEKARALILAKKEIKAVDWYIGASAPSFYYNLLMNQDGVASYAQALVTVSSVTAAERMIPILQRELDQALPQAQILVRHLDQGPPFEAPVEIRIYGQDLTVLQRLGEQLRAVLATVPTVTHTRATLETDRPKLFVNIDETKASMAGLQLVEIARQLQAALDGVVGGSVLEGTEDLSVRVRVAGGGRSAVSGVARTNLLRESGATPAGAYPGIPLTALGSISLKPSIGTITRRNGTRVNIVRGFIEAGTLPQTALNAFQERLKKAGVTVPSGYRLEIGGESAERNEAVGKLMASLGLIITLMIAAVVLSFNSFRLGGVIFLVAFQAMGLGLLSVAVFQYSLGFVVIIALIGLVGLAINASIIILSALRANEKAAAGDRKAIREVVVNETSRHIVSTTITTMGGFLPLMLTEGGFWPPFAVAIAGGTLLSTMLSFYFAPSCFLLFARSQDKTRRGLDTRFRALIGRSGRPALAQS